MAPTLQAHEPHGLSQAFLNALSLPSTSVNDRHTDPTKADFLRRIIAREDKYNSSGPSATARRRRSDAAPDPKFVHDLGVNPVTLSRMGLPRADPTAELTRSESKFNARRAVHDAKRAYSESTLGVARHGVPGLYDLQAEGLRDHQIMPVAVGHVSHLRTCSNRQPIASPFPTTASESFCDPRLTRVRSESLLQERRALLVEKLRRVTDADAELDARRDRQRADVAALRATNPPQAPGDSRVMVGRNFSWSSGFKTNHASHYAHPQTHASPLAPPADSDPSCKFGHFTRHFDLPQGKLDLRPII